MASKISQAMILGKVATWAVYGLAGMVTLAIWLGVSLLVISRFIAEEEDQRLSAFHLRAGTIALAAESMSRLNLQNGLEELARQPGIAWLAITDAAGEILQDSSPGITGKPLYSPQEISRLAPGPELQGRFLPDDENIYETWQSFRPERFRRHHAPGARIIFVALDAGGFHRQIAGLWLRAWLASGAIFGILLVAAIAAFLGRRYIFTRKRLIDTEAFARQILNNYPWAILALDKAGNVLFANEAGNALFGKKAQAVHNLAGPDWDALLAGNAGQIQEREADLERRPGVLEPVSVTISDLQGAPTPASAYLVTIRELGETRRLQRKLEEAQRLAELGKIASGLAHEIRNPLGSICGYAEYLKGRVANDPVAAATADLLAGEAARLNNALSDLLQLARKPRLKLAQIELVKPLERAFAIALPDAKARDVQLEARFDTGSGQIVNMDAERVVQVILNLLLNAIQACQPGQQVILSAAMLAAGSPEVPVELGRGKEYARITVCDNGPGMTAAVMEQIFTPYFTTRAEGAGLGLALSRQIIEAHGGMITVPSSPGNGSTFSVYLPQEQG